MTTSKPRHRSINVAVARKHRRLQGLEDVPLRERVHERQHRTLGLPRHVPHGRQLLRRAVARACLGERESCVLDRRMPLAARVTPVRTRLSSALSSAPMRGRSSFGARRASSVMDGTEGMRGSGVVRARADAHAAEPPLHRGARVRHARVHRRAELAEREGTTVGSITGARSSRGGVGTRGDAIRGAAICADTPLLEKIRRAASRVGPNWRLGRGPEAPPDAGYAPHAAP